MAEGHYNWLNILDFSKQEIRILKHWLGEIAGKHDTENHLNGGGYLEQMPDGKKALQINRDRQKTGNNNPGSVNHKGV